MDYGTVEALMRIETKLDYLVKKEQDRENKNKDVKKPV